MKKGLFNLVLFLIITSCNVNTNDGSPKSKMDSLFEEKMNIPWDTNSILNNLQIDSTSKIAELEDIISCFGVSDDYETNIESAKLLQKIDPFNEKAIEHIFRYYKLKKIDSVALFFDDLIRKHPKNIEPLLLRANMLYFEIKNYKDSLYFVEKEKYLLKAYSIDHKNVSVCYYLGELYYEDFIKFNRKKSFLNNPVDNALKFLKETIKADSTQYDKLFFAISQLEKFKNRSITITLDPLLGIDNNCYFPSWYFANLSDKWEEDFNKDYIFLIESSSGHSDWMKKQLIALNEPCLYNLKIPENYEVYRFTWLRSFDPPIVVRIVKSKNNYTIYWKVGKGMGGYEPEGIKEFGKRELSKKEWSDFENIFKKINFEDLPHSDYEPSFDGATWTLERATPKNYKAYYTKEPYKISRLCMLMVKMAGILIDEKKIY